MSSSQMLTSKSDLTVQRPSLVRAQLGLARARMDVLIQEVEDDIDVRVSRNIDAAQKDADAMRELAKLLGELMQVPVIEIARSGVTTLCKVICDVAEMTVSFERAFEKFVAEHGVLLEESAKITIRQFASWAQEQEKEMAPLWENYVAALDRDLRESQDEIRATAAEWSVVDSDGLAS